MPEEFASRDSEIGVLLEALHQEISGSLCLHVSSQPLYLVLRFRGHEGGRRETHGGDALGQWRVVVIDNGEQGRHGSEVVIWRPTLEKLDDSAPHAPDIRGGAGAGQLDDLGGHPVWSADDLRLLVLATGERAGRDAKVGKLDSAVLGGEDVGALDVAVDDTLVVEVLEALKDLGHVDADQVFRELAIFSAYRMKRAVFAVSDDAWLAFAN